MIKIICPKCKWEVKDCIYLLVLAHSRYQIKADCIAKWWLYLPEKYRKVKASVGFVCPSCDQEFPRSWNPKIKKYLKQRRALLKLLK